MHISYFKISNYKCFECVELSLYKGINVITGQNNSGKTALLGALSLTVPNQPHKSVRTLPNDRSVVDHNKTGIIEMILAGSDFRELSYDEDVRFGIPLPRPSDKLMEKLRVDQSNTEEEIARALKNWLMSEGEATLRYSFIGQQFSQAPVHTEDFPIGPTIQIDRQLAWLSFRDPYDVEILPGQIHFDPGSTLVKALQRRIYSFHANRLSNLSSKLDKSSSLSTDGSNLVSMLNQLQRKRNKFGRYVRTVQQVLPEVQNIAVESDDPEHGEIFLWMHDPSTERDDLAIPLRESGTGVAHVLAMLYLLTQEHDKILLIDEPQTFLHPGALRRLTSLFRASPQNQIIVTTNTPTIISGSDVQTVIVVKRRETHSEVEQLDLAKATDLQACLAELGATLSDVFGADRVLWVEGPTEEVCLPPILRKCLPQSLTGMVIKGVRSTSDLTGRTASLAIDVYCKLSASSALIPPAIAFLFDRETRTDEQIKEFTKYTGARICFTQRRMFENYLIHPFAISAVLTQADENGKECLEEIKALLQQEQGDTDENEWLRTLNGAKLHSKIFSKLSDCRVEYNKVRHGAKLTEHILTNDPNHFRSLCDELARILNNQQP